MNKIPIAPKDMQMDNIAAMLDLELPSSWTAPNGRSTNMLIDLLADMINDQDLVPVLVDSVHEPPFSLGNTFKNLYQQLGAYLHKLGMEGRKVHYLRVMPNNGVVGLLSLLGPVYIDHSVYLPYR